MNDQKRAGTFSSSSAHKLMSRARNGVDLGKPALTYIEEKQMELRLGRELSGDNNAKPTNWGTFLEHRVFDLLGMEYVCNSTERYTHPIIKQWTGAPDFLKTDTSGDIKCPFTLKAFCGMVDCFGDLDKFKDTHKEYYWQLVSNAILNNKPKAELVVYVPYLGELETIRELADNFDGDQNKIAFINWATDDDLPYLIEGNHYKNLNRFSFDVPPEDVLKLIGSVEKAVKLLNKEA